MRSLLFETRQKKSSTTSGTSTSSGGLSYDNLGSTASILGLIVSVYALRQSCSGR